MGKATNTVEDMGAGQGAHVGLRWSRPITNIEAKRRLAHHVAGRAQDGDVIGAGSGSTSFLTVLELGKAALARDLTISIVPTSLEIELACRAVGLRTESSVPVKIHWCFDGADEVDEQGRMIKGRGGALHRERDVFIISDERIVVADASKSVKRLGSKFPVPIEVHPRMIEVALTQIARLPHVGSCELRLAVSKDGPVFTDRGMVIVDVVMSEIDSVDEELLLRVPGVCCTGLFSGFTYERVQFEDGDTK